MRFMTVTGRLLAVCCLLLLTACQYSREVRTLKVVQDDKNELVRLGDNKRASISEGYFLTIGEKLLRCDKNTDLGIVNVIQRSRIVVKDTYPIGGNGRLLINRKYWNQLKMKSETCKRQ